MAQNNCLSKLPSIGPTQPNVYAWSDWQGGCNGASAIFPANIDVNLCRSPEYGIGANDIDSLWVPPNVDLYLDYDCNTQKNRVLINGLNHVGDDINWPGLYNLDNIGGDKYLVDNLGNGNRIGANDIDMISARVNKPWDQHLNECCGGLITDARLCGGYQPGRNECRPFLNKCSGDKLKTDPACQSMCWADPIECDKIKVGYCSANPADSYCACINVENDPAYQKFAKFYASKTGQGPRMGCSPFGKCNTGIDLVNTFLPNYVINDRKTTCPSYSNFIDQSVTTTGDGNVITTNQAANQEPPTSEMPQLITGISNILLYILLIVFVALGYYLIPANPQYIMYPQQQTV